MKKQNLNKTLNIHFTEDDIKKLDARRARRLNGESKLFNWQEAKDIITRKKRID